MVQNVVTQAQPRYKITEADKARKKAILEAWKAFHGDFPDSLQKMPDQPDDNVKSNRCQPIIDHGVDFLFGKPLGVTCAQGSPPGAQTLLDKTWGKNEARLPLLQRLAMDGGAAGRAFLRIVPHKDGSYRLVVIDPSIVDVQNAPQDLDTVLLYCLEYSVPEEMNGRIVQVFYREEIVRVDPQDTPNLDSTDAAQGGQAAITWEMQHWTRVGERAPWETQGEPYTWPYSFAPLFSCQNLPYPRSWWGIPDLPPDLIGCNLSLNLVQSQINRILRLYGSPILYATGVDFASVAVEVGRIMGLPTSESKIAAVTLVSDLANALAYLASLRANMDEQSATPAVVLGRMEALPRGAISGITMELMFMPLSQKTEKKRCLYGQLIADVSNALLTMARFSPNIEVNLAWQNPLPNDDLASVQAALGKQTLGVSNATLIQEAGYDADAEMAKNAEETARATTTFGGTPASSLVPVGQKGQIPPDTKAPVGAMGMNMQGGKP